jgi:VanZ family protein
LIKTKSFLLLAVLWFIITTVLLTLPGSALPKEDWLDKIWFDKWVHIGMFAIMVLLWCGAMLQRKYENKQLKNIFWWLAAIWLAYGIGMEFVQKYFIPNRSCDIGDMMADAVGCAVGLIYSMRRYIKK